MVSSRNTENSSLLYFVAFFRVFSMLTIEVDKEKEWIDNEKALNFLRISALMVKRSPNQKTLLYDDVKLPLISDVKCPFFSSDLVLEAWAEIYSQ